MSDIIISVPFDMLPEAMRWKNGENYRCKVVLKQIGSHEQSAEFKVVDISSLETVDKQARIYLTEGGIMKN